jgi:hypothetical protein
MFRSKHLSGSIRDDGGSGLLSALIMLMFTSFLMLSCITVLKHQMMQYRQTTHSYEARTMIEMTEVILKDDYEVGQYYPSEVKFTTGRTKVSKVSDTRFLIKAELNNQYTSQKTVDLVLKPVEPNKAREEDEQITHESFSDEAQPISEEQDIKNQ